MYCSVADMAINSLRLDVCQNMLLKVEDGNGGRDRQRGICRQNGERARLCCDMTGGELNMQFELYVSQSHPTCLPLKDGRDMGSRNLTVVFCLIQYNLDSTYLMALKPRGTYYPGSTVSVFSICHNKYNFADPQTLLHAWFITKC